MNNFDDSISVAESFFVKSGHILHRVTFDSIRWILSDGNYCTIQTREKKLVVKMSLSRLKNRLPSDHFIQIHRSYLVQIALIENIDLSSLEVIIGGTRLPLGRTFKEGLIAQLNLLQ